ncbi:hypothetical protein BDY24DRAFT_374469 [Mrakia frigida]|uniref:uncharacterized protein n=1 Tax=Mrakia frigida TaxID=29902 RepID=UPI003FCC0225
MDRQELEGYEYQLTQVQQAVDADPGNEELLSLKAELEELISLTKQAIAASHPPVVPTAGPSRPSPKPSAAATTATAGPSSLPPSSSSSSSFPTYKVSDEVLAKFTDGVFYPARIISIHGPPASPLYTVQYLGAYSATPPVQLPLSSVKPMTAQKRKALEDEKEDREKDKKKAKNEKWKEIKQSKNEEQVKKMESWQKFGVKAKKKGIAPKGLLGGSMFRSPDTVNGKVGVVNSGKGMTDYTTREKHKFTPREDEQ